MVPAEQRDLGHLQEHRLLLFWGCDPETTPWGFNGQLASRLSYWWTELGIKQIYIAPDLQLRRRRARRQVDPGAAEHRRRPLPGASPTTWLKRGHLRQGVRGDPRRRLRQVRGLRPGRRGRRSQDPGVGGADHRRALPHHQGAGPRLGARSAPPWPSATAAPASAARTPPSRRGCRPAASPCRALGKPGVHQFKMIEWGLYDKPTSTHSPCRARAERTCRLTPAANRGETPNHPPFIPKDLIHDAILERRSAGTAPSGRATGTTSSSSTPIRAKAAPRST